MDDDFTDPDHVLGAVLAACEDLTADDTRWVLTQALQLIGNGQDETPAARGPWASLCDVLSLATGGHHWEFEPTGGGCWALVGTMPNGHRIYIGTTDGPMSEDDTPDSVLAYLDEHGAVWNVSWYISDSVDQQSENCDSIGAMIAAADSFSRHYPRRLGSIAADLDYWVGDR